MIGPDPNFKVFDETIEIRLKEIGDSIGGSLPAGYGYSLLLYNFGPNGNLFYISNGNREDMVKMMKEFIALEEKKSEPTT